MAGALNTYAYISAKLRTRISMLLDESSRELESASSIEDLIEVISRHGYPEVAGVYGSTGDIDLAEVALTREVHRAYRETIARLDGEVADFVTRIARKFVYEEVKTGLRLYDARINRGESIESKLPYVGENAAQIAGSGSLEEVLQVLAGHDLGELTSIVTALEEERGRPAVEARIDRRYYADLAEALQVLPGTDRRIAERLLGIEIDLENLLRIARAETFSQTSELIDVPFADASRFRGKNLSELLAAIPGVPEPAASRSISDRLEFIEAALESQLHRTIRTILTGSPFTVGIVLSYGMLKEREAKRILRRMINLRYGAER